MPSFSRRRAGPLLAVVAVLGLSALLAVGISASQLLAGMPAASPSASAPAPTPAANGSLAPAADPPPVLVTETDVPVTVRTRTSDGRYVVTTPCGRRAVIGGGTPLYGATVVIDPGHGGETDTGAVQNGIIERDLNMDVADALANVLRGRGISVVLTRTGDYAAILSTRAALADALGATLMVSIHHNSAPNAPALSDRPGSEVFVQRSLASQRLGGLLYEHVTDALASTYDVTWYSSADAGVLRVTQPDGAETYGMIRNPATNTALIEMGWLLNPEEAAQVFESATYRSVAARALADAIESYLAGTPSDVPVGRRTFTANRAMGTDRCTDTALE